MHSVEAQYVYVEITDPMKRVLGKKTPYFIAPLAVKVERLPPWRAVTICKVRPKVGEIIPLGTQMVIDDIERDAEIFLMARVYQSFQS
jgi:hypothetical protein